MTIILLVIGFLLLILIIGKAILSFRFNREVKTLFSQSKNISDKTFNYEQLSGLPEPVQRYFKHVLKEGQSYVSYVRLIHDGQFKSGHDKDWMNIKGEQYFSAEKPGYIWKGLASIVTARDKYISDKGRLVVTILSLFNIIVGKGSKYDEGELQRWLAECIWLPTNLLPGERLKWKTIDANTAKLIFNYKDLSLFYKVYFNQKGEITQLETTRYMNEVNKETWLCKCTGYKELNGIIIPTKIEAVWKLKKGDFSYAKFKVRTIEYNKPEKF
jgi:hypothetical protein